MIIKKENHEDLEDTYNFLKNKDLKTYIVEYADYFKEKSNKNNPDRQFKFGDIKIPAGVTVKKALKRIKGRLDKGSQYRHNLVLNHGFDTKFGSHLIRLLYEGIELLETGSLEFPLKEREYIMKVKLGEVSLEEVLDKAVGLENRVRRLKEKELVVPNKPNYDFVNNLLIEIIDNYFRRI